MTDVCSLLTCAGDDDGAYTLSDYAGAVARWCPGCGDHAILTAVEKLLESEQIPPEKTMFVSGIGCSSRFPHYLRTYGFHGIHGRALPVATGIKLRRPDLHVFVVMGDGDCCSIGAAHWVHAIRYNANLTTLLLDNEIYGLTKNQTSPTTPVGFPSNTQPHGTILRPLNPLTVTLGVTNASFVAQTADWIPAHLSATLTAAYHHRGFAFVRILQRCPQYSDSLFAEAMRNPERNQFLEHPGGVSVPSLATVYKNRVPHDPRDLHRARELAEQDGDVLRLGVFYRNEELPCYDELRKLDQVSTTQRMARLQEELDRHAV